MSTEIFNESNECECPICFDIIENNTDIDIDENDYTPGYCGVKKIPAFLAIVNGVPQPIFQCSNTMKIAEWMKSGFKQ